jgi:hypothetical protein
MAKQRRKSTTKQRRVIISRRKFLEGVMGVSTVTVLQSRAPVEMPTLPTGATSSVSGVAPSAAGFTVLTLEQSARLTRVLNRLVPAAGRMPGAGDIGVAQFLDELLVDGPHLRRPILDVLADVQAAEPADPMPGNQLDEVLANIERQRSTSFNVVLQAIYTGYYSHPAVLKAIGWGESGGHAESFDGALLDAVRQRGTIYKRV